MATQNTHNSIKVANPSLEYNPRTYLTQDVGSGDTTIDVSSTEGFPKTSGSDFYVLIGEYGDEKAEIKLINASATSGNTFAIASLTNSHEASDPVTLIDYNQIRYYSTVSATASPDVSDTPLETKDIDPTSQFTEYIYTGTTYEFFASAYYNSNSDDISGFSETIAKTSFTRKSIERIIRSGARKALTTIDENPNSRLTWDIAVETLQDGLDEVSARKKRWPFWNTITTDTTTTTNQNYIDKPTDLTQLVSIKVDSYQLDWLTPNDYMSYQNKQTSKGVPSYFTEMNGKYYLYPTPDSSYDVEYNYYKTPDVITDLSTEIDIPLVPVLIHYCGAQFAYIRGNEKKGDSLYQMYVRLLEDQVIEYSGPSQDGVAEYIEHTSSLDEDADLTLFL